MYSNRVYSIILGLLCMVFVFTSIMVESAFLQVGEGLRRRSKNIYAELNLHLGLGSNFSQAKQQEILGKLGEIDPDVKAGFGAKWHSKDNYVFIVGGENFYEKAQIMALNENAVMVLELERIPPMGHVFMTARLSRLVNLKEGDSFELIDGQGDPFRLTLEKAISSKSHESVIIFRPEDAPAYCSRTNYLFVTPSSDEKYVEVQDYLRLLLKQWHNQGRLFSMDSELGPRACELNLLLKNGPTLFYGFILPALFAMGVFLNIMKSFESERSRLILQSVYARNRLKIYLNMASLNVIPALIGIFSGFVSVFSMHLSGAMDSMFKHIFHEDQGVLAILYFNNLTVTVISLLILSILLVTAYFFRCAIKRGDVSFV